MNPHTGKVYTDQVHIDAAKLRGQPLVMIEGTPEHVEAVSAAVKANAKTVAKRRARNKAARASRRNNRR